VKFPRGIVLYTGNRQTAAQMIAEKYPGEGVIGAVITAGDWGTATAGYKGTATAGNSGTATAGNSGTATAGDWGTATAGNSGTATAGNSGTATAGEKGIIQIRFYDGAKSRYRIATAYVGEDGIEPGKRYALNADQKFVEKT